MQRASIGAAEHAVVESLVGDRLAAELTLGVFMAVEAQLGVVWEVAAELEKERAEIAIEGVDVVVVDHRRRLDDPWISLAGAGAAPLLGAEHRGPLLGLADENNAFLCGKAAQMLGHHVVFALALGEGDDRQPMAGGKTFEFGNEPAAHRRHQR